MIPKKGFRKITVGDVRYLWKLTSYYDGPWLSLVIVGDNGIGQVVAASFPERDYKYLTTFEYESDTHVTQSWHGNDVKITPYVVRQVIEIALEKGWKPNERRGELRVDVEGKIEFRKVKK
jgi:hypothetical protein